MKSDVSIRHNAVTFSAELTVCEPCHAWTHVAFVCPVMQ